MLFLLILIGILIGNHVAWFLLHGRHGHPYSWRILGGFNFYLPVLEKKCPDWWRD